MRVFIPNIPKWSLSVVLVVALAGVLPACTKTSGNCKPLTETELHRSFGQLLAYVRHPEIYQVKGVTMLLPAKVDRLIKTKEAEHPVVVKIEPDGTWIDIFKTGSNENDLMRRIESRKNKRPIFLAIHPKAPARLISMGFEALRKAGLAQVDMIMTAAAPPPYPEPPDRKLFNREIQRRNSTPPSDWYSQILRAANKEIKKCPALAKFWDKLAQVPGIEPRVEKMARDMPAVFKKCGCKVNARRLMTYLFLNFVPNRTSLAGLVTLNLQGTGRSITAAPDDTWKQLAPKVLDAKKTGFRIRLTGPAKTDGQTADKP